MTDYIFSLLPRVGQNRRTLVFRRRVGETNHSQESKTATQTEVNSEAEAVFIEADKDEAMIHNTKTLINRSSVDELV